MLPVADLIEDRRVRGLVVPVLVKPDISVAGEQWRWRRNGRDRALRTRAAVSHGQ